MFFRQATRAAVRRRWLFGRCVFIFDDKIDIRDHDYGIDCDRNFARSDDLVVLLRWRRRQARKERTNARRIASAIGAGACGMAEAESDVRQANAEASIFAIDAAEISWKIEKGSQN